MLKVKTVEVATMRGYPLEGDHSLLKGCRMFLRTGWDGHVTRVFATEVVLGEKIDISWYYPCDNGGYGLFGTDENGIVMCGLVFDDHEKKFFVKPAEDTNPWR